MATSHSVWGYCPSHKRNQLAILPLATLTPLRDWSAPFVVSVFSVISVVGMLPIAQMSCVEDWAEIPCSKCIIGHCKPYL